MITRNLLRVRPRREQIAAAAPGDDLVGHPDVVMDRAFDLPAPPVAVWPWINQLGKDRAGWYLPARAEQFVPRKRRALRRIDESLQHLESGDVIPDWEREERDVRDRYPPGAEPARPSVDPRSHATELGDHAAPGPGRRHPDAAAAADGRGSSIAGSPRLVAGWWIW